MRARMAKLAAVAAMVAGLTLGGGAAAGAAPVTAPCWEGLGGTGGRGNAWTSVIRLDTDRDGAPQAGWMVGRSYVGVLPE